nr:hypothetical protein [Lysinibacillus timonensis]
MLLKIRNFFGGLFIIFSFIFGALSVGMGFDESFKLTIIMYLLFGILPLLIAKLLFEGWQGFQFKVSNMKSLLVHPGIRLYVLVTVITPILLNSLDIINFYNMDRLSSPEDVYFANISVDWLGYIIVFAGLIAFMCFCGVFVLGWKNSKKPLRYTFIISFTLSILISILINNDYQAINPDGLVISTLGNREEIPWSEVEHVNLKGNVSSDGFSKNSTSSFKWKFEFLLKNGETRVFGPFYYTKYSLEDSLNIKRLIHDKNINATTYQLSEREWEFVQVDIGYETDANVEDFYSIFQYDPQSKEYYNIQYTE